MKKQNKNSEVEKILKPYNVDIKRHMSALSEEYQSRISIVAEQVGSISENIEIIKSDIEFIKGGIKKKVDYEEFMTLERRLTLVESKVRR